MQSARHVEKLLILLDYSEGVLARLYHSTQFEPGPQLKLVPNEVKNFLLRKVADPTDGVWDLHGAEPMRSMQKAIKTETQFVYDTFADLLKTIQEIMATLTSISKSISNFPVSPLFFFSFPSLPTSSSLCSHSFSNSKPKHAFFSNFFIFFLKFLFFLMV